MAAIPWAAIFNFLITIMMMVINRMKEKEELKKEFIDFVTRVHKKEIVNVRLMRRYQDSIKR